MQKRKKKYNPQKQVFTSKHFRLFYKNVKGPGIEISISKKFYKLAVDRNKIRRKIKEIFRTESLFDLYDAVVVVVTKGHVASKTSRFLSPD